MATIAGSPMCGFLEGMHFLWGFPGGFWTDFRVLFVATFDCLHCY